MKYGLMAVNWMFNLNLFIDRATIKKLQKQTDIDVKMTIERDTKIQQLFRKLKYDGKLQNFMIKLKILQQFLDLKYQ